MGEQVFSTTPDSFRVVFLTDSGPVECRFDVMESALALDGAFESVDQTAKTSVQHHARLSWLIEWVLAKTDVQISFSQAAEFEIAAQTAYDLWKKKRLGSQPSVSTSS